MYKFTTIIKKIEPHKHTAVKKAICMTLRATCIQYLKKKVICVCALYNLHTIKYTYLETFLNVCNTS